MLRDRFQAHGSPNAFAHDDDGMRRKQHAKGCCRTSVRWCWDNRLCVVALVIAVNLTLLSATMCVAVAGVHALMQDQSAVMSSLHIRNADGSVPKVSDVLTKGFWEDEARAPVYKTIVSLYRYFVEGSLNLHVIDPKTHAMQQLVWDVSTGQEFTLIWKHMYMQGDFVPVAERYVVDIGAMDGLSGSMSYNFLEAGWHAVLVEPFPAHFKKAYDNTVRFAYFRNQTVTTVNAAVAEEDGHKLLHIFNENSHTSNSLKDTGHTFGKRTGWGLRRSEPGQAPQPEMDNSHWENSNKPAYSVNVTTITVKTLLHNHCPFLPKRFGLLTIDAEGKGDIALAGFLEEGYRPRFIIMERTPAEAKRDVDILAGYEYGLLGTTSANNVWVRRQ